MAKTKPRSTRLSRLVEKLAGHGDAVGAVAVEQQRRGAVERRALAVEQRDRHALAVGGRRQQPARDVVGGVVAARHLLRLAQGARARLHVVVEDLGRRGHRRVGEAQRRGVELVAAGDAQRIGLLGEGDGVLGAVGEAADDDARQAVLALEPRPGGPGRRSPPGSGGRACGRRSRASWPRSGAASGASQTRKSSAPPELVVMIRRSPWCSTRVFVAVLARRDQARRALRRDRRRSGRLRSSGGRAHRW